MKGRITAKMQIDKVWLEEKERIGRCECCKDVLYIKSFRLWLSKFVDNVAIGMDRTDICLCESCFDLMNRTEIKIPNVPKEQRANCIEGR